MSDFPKRPPLAALSAAAALAAAAALLFLGPAGPWLAGLLALALLSPPLSGRAIAEGPQGPVRPEDWVGRKREAALPTGMTAKYLDLGDPGKPPLLLIHGMSDTSRSWHLLCPYLASRFRLIIPDLRGHGDSSKPDIRMYPVSLYASDMAALLDSLGIPRAHVMGHSLGSLIVQALAMNYPEKVDKAILESSAIQRPSPLFKEFYDALAACGGNRPDDAFIDDLGLSPNPVDAGFMAYQVAEAKSMPGHAWPAIAKGLLGTDLSALMDEIKAPALILWGSLDGLFGADEQAALRAALPKAGFIAYEGLGHNLHWEAPERIAGDVVAFLGG